MSKSIPFNIKLSVNGQQVVVSCKRDVENLGKALGTLPTGVRRFQNSLVAFASAQSAMANLSSAIGNISGLMQGYIDKANNASRKKSGKAGTAWAIHVLPLHNSGLLNGAYMRDC